MRADAQRNRDRIIETAKTIFREQGYDASLDLIAKTAGVGAGTLYRHFPTRDDLLDAIMASWVSKVEEETEKSLATEGGVDLMLSDWFGRYVELLSTYKGNPAKITTAMGNPDSPIRTKCEVLLEATTKVLDQAADRGGLREDVDPLQVVRLVGGVATIADQGDLAREVVRPMLDVVVDGITR